VLVAFGAALVVPWPPGELGLAVLAGAVLGRWHRLGRDGIWIGVTALLMVTYGTAGDASYLALRVGEAVLGAAVGIAVNALILPPLHLRDAGRAVAAVSGEVAELLESIAAGLRGGWDESDALRWRRGARQLEVAVRHADEAVDQGRESMRLNSRRLLSHRPKPSAEDRARRVLYEVVQHTQHLTETLATAAAPDNAMPSTGSPFDLQLAGLLDTFAEGARTYHLPDQVPDPQSLTEALDRAQDRRAALARLVPSPDLDPPKDWSSHAAAMLAVERALGTMLAAARRD
jgi:uncharacterized membrane protein YccC